MYDLYIKKKIDFYYNPHQAKQENQKIKIGRKEKNGKDIFNDSIGTVDMINQEGGREFNLVGSQSPSIKSPGSVDSPLQNKKLDIRLSKFRPQNLK